MYLTLDEYETLSGRTIDEDTFNQLVGKAGDALDSITRAFYAFNSLEDDVPFRRDQFKKAVAVQIDYFSDMGATTSHGLTNIQSASIGRTSFAVGGNASNNNVLVSDDVYGLLINTGLLYRGLRCR